MSSCYKNMKPNTFRSSSKISSIPPESFKSTRISWIENWRWWVGILKNLRIAQMWIWKCSVSTSDFRSVRLWGILNPKTILRGQASHSHFTGTSGHWSENLQIWGIYFVQDRDNWWITFPTLWSMCETLTWSYAYEYPFNPILIVLTVSKAFCLPPVGDN